MRCLLVALILLLSPCAHAQAPDATVFARDPAVSSIALSPDGRQVALITRTPTEHRLMLFDVGSGTSTLIQRLTA